MKSSYKVALLAAAGLCAAVLTYYLFRDADTVETDPLDSPAQTEREPEPQETDQDREQPEELVIEQTPAEPEPDDPFAADDQNAENVWDPAESEPQPEQPTRNDTGPIASNVPLPDGQPNLQGNTLAPTDHQPETPDTTTTEPDDPWDDWNDADDPFADVWDETDQADDEETAEAEEETPANDTFDWDQPEQADDPETQPATETTHVVQAGETLGSIAREHYGHEAHWVDIARANPTRDPERLQIGDELRIPEIQPDQPPQVEPGQTLHIVQSGQSLWSIAGQYYDQPTRWREIFEANRQTLNNDPDNLQAGMELIIPEDTD